MTTRLAQIDQWIDELQVVLVDHLPAECQGGVVHYDEHGTRWLYVQLPQTVEISPVDIEPWVGWAVELIDHDRFCAVPDLVRVSGMSADEARSVFWTVALEWYQSRVTARVAS